MDPEFFATLLYRSECDYIEFKSDHYAFDTEDEKGEVLKDLMALANSWRDGSAYIFLGVQEQSGDSAQARVCGITKDLSDNTLQTFTNGKFNKPLRFNYDVFLYEGKKCAVIEIPLQDRPFFLKAKYGKQSPKVVQVRRGSSTVVADPDEIVRMGNALVVHKEPSYAIEASVGVFGDGASQRLGFFTRLENVGNATAYDLSLEVTSQTHDNTGFENRDWVATRGSISHTKFIAKHPIHRASPITLTRWALSAGVQMVLNNGLFVVSDLPYSGPNFRAEVQITARDQLPMKIVIEFSTEEIAERVSKRFTPTA